MAKRKSSRVEPEVKEIAKLILTRVETQEKLQKQIEVGKNLFDEKVSNPAEFEALEKKYKSWNNYNVEMLKRLFTTLEFSEEYYHYCNRMMFMRGGPPHWTEEYKDQKSDLKDKIDKLEEILNRLDLIEEPNIGPVARIDSTPRTIDKLKKLLSRFHKVARQLRKRHDNRNTLEIEDEYDVQDLLHALLKLEFEDIRAEEWTPSYAASSSRMDFLLKQEQTVIEVKKTSKSLKEKDVGEQLIIDIAHYRQHPDCKKLVCFVYDSEGRIGNPQGLENDLASQSTDYMQIVVIVNPL